MKGMRVRCTPFLFAIALFLSMFASVHAGRVLRVPYFEGDALCERHGNDDSLSYASEFLDTLGRYCDFDYEFVKIDRQDVFDCLRNGTIDFVPFMGRDSGGDEGLLFSDLPCAIGSTILATNRSFKGGKMRIGILNHAPEELKDKIFLYMNEHGFSADYLFYDDSDNLISDLLKEKIDAYATIDFAIPEGFFSIATIENIFFHLAVHPSAPELFSELNDALSSAFVLNPAFLSSLRMRHIVTSRYTVNNLSLKEIEYLKKNGVLRVSVVDDDAPYCAFFEGKYAGIVIDEIESLAKTVGLSIEYVPARSYEEAIAFVREGRADAVYSVSEILTQNELSFMRLTNPLLSENYICIANKNADVSSKMEFVALGGMVYPDEFLEKNFSVSSVKRLESVSACMEYVGGKRQSFTLVPELEADLYMRTHFFHKLRALGDRSFKVAVSLGLSRKTGVELSSILDKGVFSITPSMFESSMSKNIRLFSRSAGRKKLAVTTALTALATGLIAFAFVFSVTLVKRRKDMQIQHAMNLANRDSMTGLFNHIAFKKRASGILTHQAEGEMSAFVMVDIDNFKHVNDGLGHAKGDYAIVSVANIIFSEFRNADVKGRMGGDEFAVLMKNVSDSGAVEKKMRLFQNSIKEYFERESFPIKVTCSIGVCTCVGPQREDAFERMYKAADEGLYEVKKSGKNAFSIVEL